MPEQQTYAFDVPEGYPPLSVPCKPETRLAKETIRLEYCTEDDLTDLARLVYEVFETPQGQVEDLEDGTPTDVRIKRLKEHSKPWLKRPGIHMIKAVHADTGETMGMAVWHENGPHSVYPTTYSTLPDLKFPPWFVPNMWRTTIYQDVGLTQQMGWTDEDIKEMTASHKPLWTTVFDSKDRARLAELVDQHHFYLSPIGVWQKWMGKGVGKELMMWAIEKADERGWPIVLETMPNSRPVYYRLGFEPTGEHGEGKGSQLVRPPKKR